MFIIGAGSTPKPDTALTLSISRLASLLGVKPALLKSILGTTQVELRDQPKIIAGGIDSERDMGFWTFFNNIGSIHTLNVPRELYMHLLRRKCTNGAVNAGAHTFLLEPAANSIVFIYFVSSRNLDAAGVNQDGVFRTAGGNVISYMWSAAPLNASAVISFPRSTTGTGYIGELAHPAMILTDELEIIIQTGSVAVNEDTDFFVQYSYIGDAPTITETGPAGSVYTDVP